MKKFNLVACSLVLALGLTACSQSNTSVESVSNNSVGANTIASTENSTIVSDDLPEVEVIESVENESETEVIEESCTFTADKQKAVDDYLSQFTLINVLQTMENGVVDDLAKTTISYSVMADTKCDTVDLQTSNSYLFEGESGTGAHHYFKDYVNDITLERTDVEWIEADGQVQMINWDITSFENCSDIWKYLARDWQLQVGTEGYISGDFEYYTVFSEEVDKNFITGLDYDTLKSQEITYIYQSYEDNVLVPKSIIAEVIYTIGDKEYFVRSTIQLSSVGSIELQTPEYKKG